ncbi:uncharacterized protein VP01_2162g1 [Puccinia sorghi]|uniref:RING-type domain-containing protein n=1 Tax=Puccinia sorghi TaxID=27349 RepID=A0A0L6V9J5_9BASI|nr:uncharacterized protein VP01_2162g1 [Puccinia sorghi]
MREGQGESLEDKKETTARFDIKTRQNDDDVVATSGSGKQDGLNDLAPLNLRHTDACAICLENCIQPDKQYNAGEATLSVFPDCNHCFHTACLRRWLDNNLTCPMCRRLAPTVSISFWHYSRSFLYIQRRNVILTLVRLGTLMLYYIFLYHLFANYY